MKAIAKLARQCQTCSLAIWAEGPERVIICTLKEGSQGRLIVVEAGDSCGNHRLQSRNPRVPKGPPDDPNARYIPLTLGRFAIVDAEDYEELAQWKWFFSPRAKTGYAGSYQSRCKKKVWMHRQIMKAPKGLYVDHIDGNGLNNRKSNLRLCTPAQNSQNAGPRANCYSRYKGVTWHKTNKKWEPKIMANGKKYNLGSFKNETDAAVAYDRRAEILHAEFAYLNFPELAEFRKHARNLIWPQNMPATENNSQAATPQGAGVRERIAPIRLNNRRPRRGKTPFYDVVAY